MSDAIVIIPFPVTDGNLVASNVAEDDYPLWAAGTDYAVGDRVISPVTHKIYESVSDANLGNDPTNSNNRPVPWVEVGSTNRWRAFDATLGQSTTNADEITFTIGLPSRMDALALIDIIAVSARLVIKDTGSSTVYDQTKQLLDTSGIASWLDFFTYEDSYDPEQIFADLGALSGFSAEITLSNPGGVAELAEIAAGKSESLGTLLDGTKSGFTDYSKRTVDGFGNISITKRPTARRAEWEISFPSRSNRRIQRALEEARGAPAFFYPGDDMIDFYVSIYGVADDFFPGLSSGGTTNATLSLTGVS